MSVPSSSLERSIKIRDLFSKFSDEQINQLYQLYETCRQFNLLFDQSPPPSNIIESKPLTTIDALPPRKINYASLVQNSLNLFDALSISEQQTIIDKSRKLLSQTIKNHGEFLDRSEVPDKFKQFIEFLPKLTHEVHVGLLLLAKALAPDELKTIHPPGTFLKYKFMDIVVPINKQNSGHTYQLELPIMKQSLLESDLTFKRFPSDPSKTTDSKMTCDAQFVRLPDLWEVVAFVRFPEINELITFH